MTEPGIDRHEWEAEMSALEEQLGENPAESLPELDRLVARMLEETGVDDADFAAAHEISEALERGSEEISPGDVAAAINGYRAAFERIVSHGEPT
jgi:5'-deoxynucleotidase YfbR-like HD superfamily hydrolase